MIKESLKTGISFGLTSGIITTLGLIVGLHSGTHSRGIIIGGILTIAIADAFSDALGIHVSEESEAKHTEKEIWESTVSTFFSKFLFALIFIIPVSLCELSTAIAISIIMGLLMVGILSFNIAKGHNKKPWKAVIEHIIVALLVVIITHYTGDFIALKVIG